MGVVSVVGGVAIPVDTMSIEERVVLMARGLFVGVVWEGPSVEGLA